VRSPLIVRPDAVAHDGTRVTITPASADWSYVGFELLTLSDGVRAVRETGEREACVVVIAGRVDIASQHGRWPAVGGRADPWGGRPDAAYLPPATTVELRPASGPCEVALCFAPARTGTAARLLPAASVTPEARGYGAQARTIHPILMGDGEAESLLVTEVLTPAGHWSSYPPHKHDRDALPEESYLEEVYYHRVDPPRGFAIQRVYSDDRSLDETMAVSDGDVVLVPRGYHPVAAPPGYRSYYLNVMAGPTRTWVFHNDPDHEWLLTPPDARTQDAAA
jgi:5-deoxy-glucuronate isomerase